MGLIPRLGRSPGERHDNPLRYSCLENPMDRGAWWATVHRIAKRRTRLKQLSMHDSEMEAALSFPHLHLHRQASPPIASLSSLWTGRRSILNVQVRNLRPLKGK